MTVEVRHLRKSDIPQVVDIQTRVYPDIGGWRPEQIARQLHVFPQGQVVAVQGRRVVGAASSLIVRWDDYGTRHTWKEVTGGGSFDTHDPAARTLYGAEVFADPDMLRLGVGSALYAARRKICRMLNLRRIMACGRLPNYHRHAAAMSPEEYAMRVIWGDLEDTVLLFQMRKGFHYCGICRGYLASDTESCGNATIIVWLNPQYRRDRPTVVPAGPIL
jgi:GNAT superfamily N-acetyltransferase